MSDDLEFTGDVTPPPVHAVQRSRAKKVPPVNPPVKPREPVRAAEVVAVVLWTILADLLVFRTLGYCGLAVFFALAPIIFAIVPSQRVRNRLLCLIVGLLGIVVASLIWQGSTLAIFSAGALVVGFAMSASGATPWVLESAALAARCALDGMSRLSECRLPRQVHRTAQTHSNLLAILIPAGAFIVFSSIFVFANPNLFSWVSGELTWISTMVLNWGQRISIFEIPFCIASVLVGTGLMRPSRPLPQIGPAGNLLQMTQSDEESTWYPAFRNTLFTLIGLFKRATCILR